LISRRENSIAPQTAATSAPAIPSSTRDDGSMAAVTAADEPARMAYIDIDHGTHGS